MDKEYVHYPVVGGTYKHYKGGRCKVITMATHSETDEPVVVYKSILFGSVHVRPLSMWFDKVEPLGPTNQTVRFELIQNYDTNLKK